MPEQQILIPCAAVEAETHLTRSTIYRLMNKGDFPKPIRLGERKVRWYLEEVRDWITSRERAGSGSGD